MQIIRILPSSRDNEHSHQRSPNGPPLFQTQHVAGKGKAQVRMLECPQKVCRIPSFQDETLGRIISISTSFLSLTSTMLSI